jgi:hypothetical protein
MVGQKTEEVYRRYAIVDETMIREAAIKMNEVQRRGGTSAETRKRQMARKHWMGDRSWKLAIDLRGAVDRGVELGIYFLASTSLTPACLRTTMSV